ncbi:MAG: nitroreductase family protein [Deltaproteobacteria bacterium]|nr:nitroreductase family protein [Deltaproteobacteria bacterium]
MPVIHSLYREGAQVEIDDQNCSRCGSCAAICPAQALCLENGHIRLSEDSSFGCIGCGHCMAVCPKECIVVKGRGISPDDLIPLPAPAAKADADSLQALMEGRRSMRHFEEREIEPEVLDRIVAMASSAPMSIPPWDVGCVTIRSREKVRKLTAEIIRGYEGFLKTFRPWLLESMRLFIKRETYEQFKYFIRPLAEMYLASYREGRDIVFFDAPAVIIFHHSPYIDSVDTTIATTYAMLAAESLGLGSTIIGGAPPILQRNRKLCDQLDIPKQNKPATALVLGYPSITFRKALRRHFSHVQTV